MAKDGIFVQRGQSQSQSHWIAGFSQAAETKHRRIAERLAGGYHRRLLQISSITWAKLLWISTCAPRTCTYTYAFIFAFTRTYTYTYTYIYIYRYVSTYIYIHTPIHIYIYMCMYMYIYTHIRRHLHMDSHVHMHKHTHTYTFTVTYTYAFTSAHANSYTYICIYIHIHLHVHLHILYTCLWFRMIVRDCACVCAFARVGLHDDVFLYMLHAVTFLNNNRY